MVALILLAICLLRIHRADGCHGLAGSQERRASGGTCAVSFSSSCATRHWRAYLDTAMDLLLAANAAQPSEA